MNAEWMILARATVLLSFCALIVLALRHRGASVRHAIWTAGLTALLLLPLTEVSLPKLGLPVLPTDEVVIPEEVQAFVAQQALPSEASANAPIGESDGTVAEEGTALWPDWPLTVWFWIVWASGSFVMLSRLALGSYFLRHLVSRTAPADADDWGALVQELTTHFSIGRSVSVRLSRENTPPMTRGIRRHVVILPAAADEWQREKRRLVLAHELAHIKRHDGLTQALIQLALTLYWFHPLVWYAAHRSRIERERAADAEVLTLGADNTAYAEHLLATVGELGTGLAFATVSIARPSELDGRLTSILNPRPRNKSDGKLARWAFGLGAVLTIATSVITFTRQDPFEFPEPVEVRAQVVSVTTGEAIPNANVRLTTGQANDFWETALTLVPQLGQWLASLSYEGRTDLDGQVTFTSVTPETHYFVNAEVEGFLPNAAPPVATVSEQGALSPRSVALLPPGKVSGRVLDPTGDGLEGVRVRLLFGTANGLLAGHPEGTPLTFITDASGGYAIAVPPGEYIVQGLTTRDRDYPTLPASDRMPLYSPGVYVSDQALRVIVGAGEEIADVDLVFPGVDHHRIVVSVNSDALPGELVMWSDMRPVSEDLLPYVVSGGRLDEISPNTYRSQWVAPGTYEIAVWGGRRDEVTYFAGINDRVTEITRLTVTVADDDVQVEAVLEPPESMPVRILATTEILTLAGEGAFSVEADLMWPSGPATPMTPASGGESGMFEIPNISTGEYSIAVRDLPAGLYVDRILYAGEEVSEGLYVDFVTYSGGEVSAYMLNVRDTADILEIEIASGAGTIAGTVRNASGDPVPLAMVGALGDGREGEARLVQIQAGVEGDFRIDTLGPGNYRLYAADVYQNQYPNLEWLGERADQLAQVTVGAGEETIVDVPLLGR